MKKKIKIIRIDDDLFNSEIAGYCDSVNDKVFSCHNQKVGRFKVKMEEFFNRFMDSFDNVEMFLDDVVDSFADGIIVYFDRLERKRADSVVKKDEISVFDKLIPMMTDEEMKKYDDKDEKIEELKKFKEELLLVDLGAKSGKEVGKSRGIIYFGFSVLLCLLVFVILIGFIFIKNM